MVTEYSDPSTNRLQDNLFNYSDASTSRRWFAVNTHPQSEARARTNLERQGWHCYSPYLLRTARVGRTLINQSRALFPSYIFVELDLDVDAWRSVDSTFGVRCIVKQEGRPVALPVGCVETMMQMTDESGHFSFSARLKPGSSVQFKSGPFTGLIGTLENIDAAGRVNVLISLLGQLSRVKTSADDVAPAKAAAARSRSNIDGSAQTRGH